MADSSHRLARTWLTSFIREHHSVQAKARHDLFENFPDHDEDEPAKAKAPEKKEPGLSDDPLFDRFLGERYEGGKGKVPNPVRENRERHPDVAFNTAMKDEGFRRRVKDEFEEWKGKKKDDKRAPSKSKRDEEKSKGKSKKDEGNRVEIGQLLKSLSQIRPGDVIKSDRRGAPYRRIVEIPPGGEVVVMQEIDEDGEVGPPTRFVAKSILSGHHTRVEDPASPEKRKQREEAKEKAEREKKDRIDEQKKRRQEKFESFPAWRKKQQAQLDIALSGTVTKDKPLGGGVNTSVKRTMTKDGKSAAFVWKPVKGEQANLRTGIKAGEYHQREEAGYAVDALFGDGTVVPPTASDGEGSYQVFEPGSKTFYETQGSLRLTNDELENNEDFHRIMFLDQVLGHEDRHYGNIMFKKDKKSGKIRFIAIDNGLALADPEAKDGVSDYCMREPWTSVSGERTDDRQEMLIRVFSDVPEKMHERMKAVKMDDFVDALVDSGITNEKIVRAAAVRLAAFQHNPKVLHAFVKNFDNPMIGLREFQHASAFDETKLVKNRALQEIEASIKRALRR